MTPTHEITLCELCKLSGSYRPNLNRVLCVKHTKELELEFVIYIDSVKNIERLAFEMLNRYHPTLERKKIVELIKKASKASLDPLEMY